VYEEETIELQDGTEVHVKPLNLKQLRRFMAIVKKLESVEDEFESIEVLAEACAIAIEKSNPKLAADTDALEEAFDVPTMYRIMEIAGGVKMNGPNQTAAGLPGMN
jgi:hypothetical protein